MKEIILIIALVPEGCPPGYMACAKRNNQFCTVGTSEQYHNKSEQCRRLILAHEVTHCFTEDHPDHRLWGMSEELAECLR